MKLIVIAALALAGCASPPPPVPIDPGEDVRTDPYPDDDGAGDSAAQSCLRLWQCRCPESGRNPAGETCPSWVRRAGVLIRRECIRTTRTCSALAACAVECRR